MDDYYAFLGVPHFCSDKVLIRSRYKEQIKYFHPDQKNVPEEIAFKKTQMLNEIYEIFSDAVRKRDYDIKLAQFLQKKNRNEKGNTNQEKSNEQRYHEKDYRKKSNSENDNHNADGKTSYRSGKESTSQNSWSKNGISYVIKRNVGVISSKSKGWVKEINIISWNGRQAKYDIRDWAPDHQKMGKGVTLTEQEARSLYELLKKLFR